MRLAVAVALCASVMVAGCGSSGSKSKSNKKGAGEKTVLDQMSGSTINVAPGTGKFNDDKQQPLWDVTWETMAVDPANGGKGALRTVRGHLFTNGVSHTTFEAEAARVDRKAQLLILHGAVKIVSDDPKATLTCDNLRYEAINPKRRIMKAQGNVRIVGEVGDLGPTAELWASPDLNIAATPGMFDQP